jgi:hypothetical protein
MGTREVKRGCVKWIQLAFESLSVKIKFQDFVNSPTTSNCLRKRHVFSKAATSICNAINYLGNYLFRPYSVTQLTG